MMRAVEKQLHTLPATIYNTGVLIVSRLAVAPEGEDVVPVQSRTHIRAMHEGSPVSRRNVGSAIANSFTRLDL